LEAPVKIRWFKVVVFLACLGPLARLLWRFFGAHPTDMSSWGAGLGANPIEFITHSTGNWTLIFLLITLAVTPMRKLLRQPWLIRYRRMLGLFAFFYGTLHLTTYVWLDKFFDVHAMLADVAKRRFITAGFTAYVLMVPLALTSTSWAIRKLGGKRWRTLHRLIYLSATAGVIHYIWLVKADLHKPLEYALVLSLLLGYRGLVWALPRVRARKTAPAVGWNQEQDFEESARKLPVN
jgi:sulfoxide reductase heme-binding subunit YedZ